MKYLLIIKKMKKLNKNIFYLLLILMALSACQTVKDGLTGNKQTNSDEFLVQKKNPLTLPPEFTKLPEPYSSTEIVDNNKSDIDIKKILTKKTSTTNTESPSKTFTGSLEKGILEKIKSN